MLKPISRLFGRRGWGCTTHCGCSTAPPSIQLPDAVIPSEALLATLDRRMKSLLAKRMAEVEYLYTISTEVPSALSSHHWLDLCDITSAREREHFLRSIHFTELGRERVGQGNAETLRTYRERLAADRRRHDAGEMVYGGADFHGLFGALVGVDFRAIVDRRYGSSFWTAYRLNEPPTKLIIDCRNLHLINTTNVNRSMRQIQTLYDRNWSSGRPFEIVIANFLVDNTTARAIRKHWYFLYGPPSHNANQPRSVPLDCVDDVVESLEYEETRDFLVSADTAAAGTSVDTSESDVAGSKCYRPHPFIPIITNRSVPDVLVADGIRNEEAVYISPWSRAFLDDRLTDGRSGAAVPPPPAVRAIVLPVMDNTTQPWHNSLTAAVADNLPAYRLPVEKHIIVRSGASKSLPLTKVFDILYGVINAGRSWEEMITTYAASIAEKQLQRCAPDAAKAEAEAIKPEESKSENSSAKLGIGSLSKEECEAARLAIAAVRRRRIKLLEDMAAATERRHIELSLSHHPSPLSQYDDGTARKKRVHRYTREERNERRRRQQSV